MIMFNDALELELMEQLKQPGGKTVDEIQLPSAPPEMVLGQPNPFYGEAIRRHIHKLSDEGLAEMVTEQRQSPTGSRSYRFRSGRWKLTSRGISVYIEKYKAAIGEK